MVKFIYQDRKNNSIKPANTMTQACCKIVQHYFRLMAGWISMILYGTEIGTSNIHYLQVNC